MPIDLAHLQQALQQGYAEYVRDAKKAVRSGKFIGPIHAWCAAELAALGLPGQYLVPHADQGGYVRASVAGALGRVQDRIRSRLRSKQHETLRQQLNTDLERITEEARGSRLRVLGGYLEKEIDVCLMVEDTGPLLAISVKSQMSSIAKNTINRFEEYVGDATNLHTRYPMLVLGFLLLIPVTDETWNATTNEPTPVLKRIHALLEQATGRDEPSGVPGSYEASALAVVDFRADPPVILDAFPAAGSPLRMEGLFDRLVALYRKRNQPLALRSIPGADQADPADVEDKD